MPRWWKKLKAKLRFSNKTKTPTASHASLPLPHAVKPLSIPLTLSREWLDAARHGKMLLHGSNSNRIETQFSSRARGYEVEIKMFGDGKMREHRTYEYDSNAQLARAIITLSGSSFITYDFVREGEKLVLRSAQKL